MSYFYLGSQKALHTRKSGLRIIVDLKDLGTINFISTDIYEPDVSFVLEHFLKPGSIFVDVGANIGVHALEAGRLMKLSGQVVAIEANPALSAILRDNVRLNGYHPVVTCHDFAAWSEEGVVEFSALEDAHRVGAVRMAEATNYGDAAVSIPAKPLDALALDAARVALVKIDVEGREGHVVEGMRRTLSASDCAIVAEYQPDLIEETYGLERFHALMRDLGRSPRAVDLSQRRLVDIGRMPSGHSNIVWVRPA